jgi:hypothetical protein
MFRPKELLQSEAYRGVMTNIITSHHSPQCRYLAYLRVSPWKSTNGRVIAAFATRRHVLETRLARGEGDRDEAQPTAADPSSARCCSFSGRTWPMG